ncbi:unnamed protein product [Effrenium voratum]|uniref:EF-hand domain-containing protein n=1 Tax=Effrenium voratum TaxID=2562239 RepID=A0AA36INM9_9DINO|nr:unnamed protein product [Effrenium voratum]
MDPDSPAPVVLQATEWSPSPVVECEVRTDMTESLDSTSEATPPRKQRSREIPAPKALDSGDHERASLSSFEFIDKSRRKIRQAVRDTNVRSLSEVKLALLRHHIGEVLNSQKFDTFLGLIIIANAVNIGIDISLQQEGKDTWIPGLFEDVFLAVYTVELIMRLFVDCRGALRDPWVRFDLFLVSTGVFSQWILEAFFVSVSEVHVLLMLRVARLLRLAKTVRFLMRFRELWMLVQGLANSAYTMVYTILLLFVVLYCFACLILQLLYKHPMLEQDEAFATTVRENFSDLQTAMVTLLQFVSFDNIVLVYKPLADRDPVLLVYFILVILVVGIVIMNLVTAVIVNSSLEQAAKDKSLLQSIEEQNRKKVVAELRCMFYRLDHDCSGEVSREEISRIATHEKQILRDLTGFDDPTELFDALDLDESGELGIEEFCDGLWQVAISDSPLEIKRMQKQVEHIKHHLTKYMHDTDQIKATLRELVAVTQRMESGVNSISASQMHTPRESFHAPMPDGTGSYATGSYNVNSFRVAPLIPEAGPVNMNPSPSHRRRSITSKAADMARGLLRPWAGSGEREDEEETPLWAQHLVREVQELRSLTENVVISSLAEVMPRTSGEERRRRMSQTSSRPSGNRQRSFEEEEQEEVRPANLDLEADLAAADRSTGPPERRLLRNREASHRPDPPDKEASERRVVPV